VRDSGGEVGRGIRKDKGKKGMEITRPFWTSKQSMFFGRAVLFNILYLRGDIHDLSETRPSSLFKLLGWSLNLVASLRCGSCIWILWRGFWCWM
jgi:hypothetical protein